jgi:hypothetical protein
MQHVFEFVIDHRMDMGEEQQSVVRTHEFYITESSRMNKVAKKILQEKNITINNVDNFQLRKVR